MTIKIMILVAADDVTGPVKGILQLIESFNPEDTFACLYNFEYNDQKNNSFNKKVKEKEFPVTFLIQKNKSYFLLIRQVVAEVREYNYPIVQTHGFKPTFLGFFAKMICKVKWVCFMHGTTSENLKVRFYNFIDNILQMAADRTVLVSEAQRSRIFGGRNAGRVHVLHNSVDMDHPMPISLASYPLLEAYELPAASRIVVAVGRFSPEKGIDILLEAFSLLLRQMDSVHLFLVGDGQERPALEGQALRLGVAKNVHFVGYSQTPGDFVAEADVLVLTSRSEGIPNAVLEAMAMGKPVVATKVGGVPEIIEDDVSGRLVPPGRPDLIASALAEVLADEPLRHRLGAGGRKKVMEAFSIQARVAKVLTLYRDVLSEKS